MYVKKRLHNFLLIITQHKKLFFFGVVIKLILGAFLGGENIVHLFTPFLKYATTHNFFNAYNNFFENGKGNAFPYPSVMLLVLSIPKFLLSFLSNQNIDQTTFVDLISIRITLFLADLVILYILLQWLKKYTKQVMWIYWLSPILIYINYIHGQLDVIPLAFLFICLYYLFKNKCTSACIYLALAIGCKTSIFLAVPFILIYAYKTFAKNKVQFWRAIIVLIVLLFIINVPLFFSNSYFQMVFNNAEQVKLFTTAFPISTAYLFLIVPAIYLLLVIRFSGYWQMSRNLLLMYLGFAFGTITIFIAANQGWYYWCMPFFIYFLIKEYRFAILPFICVNVFYFIHFGCIENSDYNQVFNLVSNANVKNNMFSIFMVQGFNTELIVNLTSTLLQASIIGFCYFIYIYGISQIQHNKMLYQPYIIGIAGDSATGKTTLANSLQTLFGVNNTTILNGDDMHKWERGNEKWNELTHLNPKANNLHLNMWHLLKLSKGNAIERKHYNHTTGSFDKAEKININRIVLLEGLHSFYLEYQKTLFDIKIFMKPADEIRVNWKLERDVQQRGKEAAEVLESIKIRKEDALHFIKDQEITADIVIGYIKNIENNLVLQIECENHIYLDEIIEKLQGEHIKIEHYFKNNKQCLNIVGAISKEQIKNIANDYDDELEDLGFGEVCWKNDYDGILQVLLVQIIFYKMQLFAANSSKGI
jgi:uridine kinase